MCRWRGYEQFWLRSHEPPAPTAAPQVRGASGRGGTLGSPGTGNTAPSSRTACGPRRLPAMPSWDLSISQVVREFCIPVTSLRLRKLNPTLPDDKEPGGVDPSRSRNQNRQNWTPPTTSRIPRGPRAPGTAEPPRAGSQVPCAPGTPRPGTDAAPRGRRARGWRVGGPGPSGSGRGAQVPKRLTAQGDHKVAQQQQQEAVAAPPRHLPAGGGGGSSWRRVRAAGARRPSWGP